MSHHDIKLYNQLIVNSAQGFHNTIEYLLFQIQYFQKKKFKGLFEKKSTLSENFGGGDLFPTPKVGTYAPYLLWRVCITIFSEKFPNQCRKQTNSKASSNILPLYKTSSWIWRLNLCEKQIRLSKVFFGLQI